jgi:hypothetical protein
MLASAGWAGEEIKNLSLRLLHYERDEQYFPACGVWKSRVRCKSAGGVKRRRSLWEALTEELRDDGLRLVCVKIMLTTKYTVSAQLPQHFTTERTPTCKVRRRSSLLPSHPHSRVLSCHHLQGRPSYNQVRISHTHDQTKAKPITLSSCSSPFDRFPTKVAQKEPSSIETGPL